MTVNRAELKRLLHLLRIIEHRIQHLLSSVVYICPADPLPPPPLKEEEVLFVNDEGFVLTDLLNSQDNTSCLPLLISVLYAVSVHTISSTSPTLTTMSFAVLFIRKTVDLSLSLFLCVVVCVCVCVCV